MYIVITFCFFFGVNNPGKKWRSNATWTLHPCARFW